MHIDSFVVVEVPVLCVVYLIITKHTRLKAEDWGVLYKEQHARPSSFLCWIELHTRVSLQEMGEGLKQEVGRG